MNYDKNGFFAFGNNLNVNIKSEPAAELFPEGESGSGLYTCAVCNTRSNSPLCAKCGYDNSRNYEVHPTIQKIKTKTPAVSLFKVLWNPPEEPSVEQTMALLKTQKWDKSVLDSVEEILNRATGKSDIRKEKTPFSDNPENGNFSKQPAKLSRRCSVCDSRNDLKNLYCLNCGAKLNTFSAKKYIEFGK